MLTLEIPEREFYDDATMTFVVYDKATIQLEHSLVSLSKWESTWCKSFINTTNKTEEETTDYIKCMTITQNVKPETYLHLPSYIFQQVEDYINKPMTATWFNESKNQKNREIITAELIYYWMIALTIPMECQKWHLNRLMTLIRVCNIKNDPPKKQGKKEMLSQRAALNQARRAQHHTKG